MSLGGSNPTSYGATNPRYGIRSSNEMVEPDVSDFYSLCDMISSNIFAVNSSASTLERALKTIGTGNDSISLRDKIHETQQITNKSIAATTGSFQTLSTTARSGDRQQKLHLDRLKNEFQETVKHYSNLQKRVANKIKLNFLSVKSQNENMPTGWGDAVEDDDDDRQHLLDQEQQRAQIQAVNQEIEFDTAMAAERESRVKQIEADILDVNQIFRDLGTMVHEQGEAINSIEGHIEKASHEVSSGREQLQKANKYLKGYRKKMCILLIILLVVGSIIAIIIATQVHSK